VVASNRRARHEYDILDVFEAGIVLRGSEVKSLRASKVQLSDTYARIVGNEAWLIGMHISPYSHASGFGAHVPERDRKLLLHRSQIDDLRQRIDQEKLTLVPLSLYFKDSHAKVELALARGRKHYDKRQAIARRDAARDIDRVVAGRAMAGRTR
jgi:SsrA-binding protein